MIVSANPVFTAVLAALFLHEPLTSRKVAGLLLGIAGVTFIVWHRISTGADSLHGVAFTLASLASIVAGTILFKLLAPKGSLWLGNGIQNLAGGLVLLPFAFTLSMSALSCRARACWPRSRFWCWAVRFWPICCGFIC